MDAARATTSSTSPTAITRGAPSSVPASSVLAPPALARAARSALRDARTRSCERDGARISTRWPRRESSPATRSTCALTSLSSASHGYGVTWAIENEVLIGYRLSRLRIDWRRPRTDYVFDDALTARLRAVPVGRFAAARALLAPFACAAGREPGLPA